MSALYLFVLLLPLCLAEGIAIQRDGDVEVGRFGRSLELVKIGAAAANKLLKGSAKIEKRSKSFNFFLKKGNQNSAWREFMSVVDPETVIRYTTKFDRVHFQGRAGDRTIYYAAHDHMEKNMPTITVFDPKRTSMPEAGPLSDKIIYRDIDSVE